MRSGQNNTCGQGGNELEGMQKMCSAERSPLEWMGSLQKPLLGCPLKHLQSTRDDSVYPAGSCWMCTCGCATIKQGAYCWAGNFLQRVRWKRPTVQPSAPQWELPVVLRALCFKRRWDCKPTLFWCWLSQSDPRISIRVSATFELAAKNFTCSVWRWWSLMHSSPAHLARRNRNVCLACIYSVFVEGAASLWLSQQLVLCYDKPL